jgi:iron complex outermembrane recepter protein
MRVRSAALKVADRQTWGWSIAILTTLIQPAVAKAEFKSPAIAPGESLAQQEPAERSIQITGVRLEQAANGISIRLDTADGKTLQPTIRQEGNSAIATIPQAVLALPDSKDFRAENPAAGIESVAVTQLDATTVQVRVTGVEAVPLVEVGTGESGLSLSVQPKEGEEIEIVVTGEREEGYRAPNASTATRTDTPIRDIPQSIQVVPQQVIQDQEVTRISDALRNVSGVSVERGYADNTDYYRIRGFVNYNTLRNGFSLQDPSINPTNIDRIEVLKGPASVLYGQFEPGGIVNYVTKKSLENPYFVAEFTAGSYNFYNPSIDISGPLNDEKTFLYRFNASYLNSGSFVDFVDREQFAIALALSYKISDATTLDFEYEYIDERRGFYDGLLPDLVSFKLPIGRFLGDPSNEDYTTNSNNINLTLNHRFSDNLQLRSSFGTQLGTFYGSVVRPGSLLEDGRSISRYYQIDDNVEVQSYFLQTNLIGKFNTGSIQHQVLLGLDLNRSFYANDYYNNFGGDESLIPPLDLFNPVYGVSPSQLDRN